MFRVMLEGHGLLLRDADTKRIDKLGFFTTRWVRAQTPAEAERLAEGLVREELAVKCGRPDAPFAVSVSELVRLSPLAALWRRSAGGGFSFFPDED